jgi:molybdopterin/thiamine biosynthesis adenylyltransferase
MRIVFCGVGALGSIAATLCRNLEASFALIDFDRVESKNVLAQAYVKQSIGKNKAEALKLQLFNFYGVKSEAFGVRVTAENVEALCGGADLIVDCFDNAKSRLMLSEFARRANKPLLHGAISADGTFGLVRWDERFTADAEGRVKRDAMVSLNAVTSTH